MFVGVLFVCGGGGGAGKYICVRGMKCVCLSG